jgi:tetratricopeptide (TPR) repeat protein
MLAIKKPAALFSALILTVLALALFTGCADPGPRALLQGERLLREHHYAEAIEKLLLATRLLPKEAQAWNHLGLAHHGAGHTAEAAKAYQQALALNRNLAAVHYNLGCLHLEQNNIPAALAELTSYTGLQPNLPDGWIRLGTAQLRAHQPDPAEKSFRQSLKLNPRSPEAWNGLGLVQVQRRRYQDAYQQFNAALRVQPDYAPAILNAAIVSHQYLNGRPVALQKYREYLALQPPPAAAADVQQIVHQLELELAPQPLAHPPQANTPPQVASLAHPAPASSLTAKVATVEATNKTESAPPVQPAAAEHPRSNPPAASPPSARLAGPTSPPPATSGPPPIASAPLELVRLADEEPIRQARDTAPAPDSRSAASPASNPQSATLPAGGKGGDVSGQKAGVTSRLNPKNWFRSKDQAPPPAPENRALGSVGDTNRTFTVAKGSAPAAAGRETFPRYRYLSPPAPAPGNRAEAERFLAAGVRDQERNRLSEAMESYRQGLKADPAFFDAHYNLGVAAQQAGDLSQCLRAYEYALAINPASVKARFNFAVALQKAGYPRDAANELEKVLADSPAEARAHFTLGNLCAQQLGEPARAREHYLRLLELEPQHPQATAVRYWLEANP